MNLKDDDNSLSGLAICHCGAGSEAGSGVCYIKFVGGASLKKMLAEIEALLANGGYALRFVTECNVVVITSIK